MRAASTVAALLLGAVLPGSAAIQFDDSAPSLVVLSNDSHWEVAFRKSNGAIAHIVDRATGQQVCLGSRFECLWGAVFPGGSPDFVGGCSYSAGGPQTFSHSWSPETASLQLTYTPDPLSSHGVSAEVTVTASEDSWFDMRIEVQNHQGSTLEYLLFPSDLVFLKEDIEGVLLPSLPGVVLEPQFFAQDRSFLALYPASSQMFADFHSVDSTRGQMAVYSLQDLNTLCPVQIGFIDDDAYIADSTYAKHSFALRLGDGESWISPTVRIRISQSHLESIESLRVDTGLALFPSLREKLGGLWDQVAQAAIFKADATQLGIPFTEYPPLLTQIPSPGILHPVAYQVGSFDRNHPDFLPPDPALGTTEEFAAMFREAQSRGLLVMPYTNPTWWNDESPTVQNLPAPVTIEDIAVLSDTGEPRFEVFTGNGGYVVSPHPAFVRQRLQQLNEDMTGLVPSDLIFEDQIGARPPPFDHNASSPRPSAYMDGWLAHTRLHGDSLLMTELGFDRLAETEVGLCGSHLLAERTGLTDTRWGQGNWRPYPLATILLRDKVLFFQHDLAPETMTADRSTFTWNLSMGFMFTYDLVSGGLDNPWLRAVGTFQRHVLSRYADERVTDFTEMADGVTRTSFETVSVIANWSETLSHTLDGYTLPPMGALVVSDDGSTIGGFLTALNGVALSPGEHCLIVERGPSTITVRQPLGSDTALTLDRLPTWSQGDLIAVQAFSEDSRLVASEFATNGPGGVTFLYRQDIGGESIGHFALMRQTSVGVQLT